MLKLAIALVLLLALAAILVAVGASPPGVRAYSPPATPTPHRLDRCDSPNFELRLHRGYVVLSVYPDDSARCRRPHSTEISYGSSVSANGHRYLTPFSDLTRVAIRNFRLGGPLYFKVRTTTGNEISWWSAPKPIELPERPEPLPAPLVAVEPAEYDSTTPWVQVSWSNVGDADRFEVEAFDAEGNFNDGDRTSESSIRYRPDNSSSAMKFRVKGVADGYYSDWSSWVVSRRSD